MDDYGNETPRRRDLNCSQQTEVALLRAHYLNLQKTLDTMSNKMDSILVEMANVRTLEGKLGHHNEALNRAFMRIEVVEKQSDETAKLLLEFMAQIRGMTKLAVALWTVMGGVVGWLVSKFLNQGGTP